MPVQRIFDRKVKGHCIIDPVPWAILLGGTATLFPPRGFVLLTPEIAFCIFVDFFFAVFPWVFLYDLEMKKKEKMIVGCSLSIGIMYAYRKMCVNLALTNFFSRAGISGIIRTVNLPGLGSLNYTGRFSI